CAFDIPESAAGAHEVVFETRALGDSFDYRWAVWREPCLTWETFAPEIPAVSPPQNHSHPQSFKPMNATIATVSAETACAADAGDPAALKALARAYLEADRHEDARALCRQVLFDNPKDREALDLLGRCRFDFSSLDVASRFD